MFQKLIKLFVSLLLIVSAGGCRKAHVPNEKRGTNYQYDFIDFMTISMYGEDGTGKLEITPIDVEVEDFESEEEYIKVKKDLMALNLTYMQDGTQSPKLKVSKTTDLSNGDIVRIQIKDFPASAKSSDMNTETYEYVVEGLAPLTEIDLFDENFVTFYATTDDNLYFHIHNRNMYDTELSDHLTYTIRTSEAITAGKTVLSITANMDSQFLTDSGYNTIDMYLLKHGYKAALEKDTVLDEVVEPIDFGVAGSIAVEKALYESLYAIEGENLVKICNLQQTPRQKSAEPYNYMVVFSAEEEKDSIRYFRRQVKMVKVDNEYVVLENSDRESCDEKYVYEPFSEANMILNFTVQNWEDPNAEPAEEPQQTEEVETGEGTQDTQQFD